MDLNVKSTPIYGISPLLSNPIRRSTILAMTLTRTPIDFANYNNYKSGITVTVHLFSEDRGTPKSIHPPAVEHQILACLRIPAPPFLLLCIVIVMWVRPGYYIDFKKY